jgi:hypothetical protein
MSAVGTKRPALVKECRQVIDDIDPHLVGFTQPQSGAGHLAVETIGIDSYQLAGATMPIAKASSETPLTAAS